MISNSEYERDLEGHIGNEWGIFKEVRSRPSPLDPGQQCIYTTLDLDDSKYVGVGVAPTKARAFSRAAIDAMTDCRSSESFPSPVVSTGVSDSYEKQYCGYSVRTGEQRRVEGEPLEFPNERIDNVARAHIVRRCRFRRSYHRSVDTSIDDCVGFLRLIRLFDGVDLDAEIVENERSLENCTASFYNVGREEPTTSVCILDLAYGAAPRVVGMATGKNGQLTHKNAARRAHELYARWQYEQVVTESAEVDWTGVERFADSLATQLRDRCNNGVSRADPTEHLVEDRVVTPVDTQEIKSAGLFGVSATLEVDGL